MTDEQKAHRAPNPTKSVGKNRRRRSTKAKTVDGQRVTPVTEIPASQRNESPPCSLCHSPQTFIYSTRRPRHYFKCRRCGFTDYFDSETAAGVVQDIQTR